MKGLTPICNYCGKFSKKVTGKVIYPHRIDLWSLTFYHCNECKDYVGCHGDTDKPLGRLANAELIKFKGMAHEVFDTLWREKLMKRNQAYKWLAVQLGIESRDCHIGMFDIETCKKVIELPNEKYLKIMDFSRVEY